MAMDEGKRWQGGNGIKTRMMEGWSICNAQDKCVVAFKSQGFSICIDLY